ncbi:hypothetical protein OAE40_01075 [Rubripirellula sp.]|nr:hypothetical protein [Rubripirellula sp.]
MKYETKQVFERYQQVSRKNTSPHRFSIVIHDQPRYPEQPVAVGRTIATIADPDFAESNDLRESSTQISSGAASECCP